MIEQTDSIENLAAIHHRSRRADVAMAQQMKIMVAVCARPLNSRQRRSIFSYESTVTAYQHALRIRLEATQMDFECVRQKPIV
ncbi:hypothetical protein, partial [Acinetobacter baumannii]|uniref:hypothetical protein n=1 Tax=Acinetobacter baumannii TaxID=470 RepID=UPI00227A0863